MRTKGTQTIISSHLFDVVFRQSRRSNIHSILLHFLAHVSILDYCFSLLRHCQSWLGLFTGDAMRCEMIKII